jgi:hypothetical protein
MSKDHQLLDPYKQAFGQIRKQASWLIPPPSHD